MHKRLYLPLLSAILLIVISVGVCPTAFGQKAAEDDTDSTINMLLAPGVKLQIGRTKGGGVQYVLTEKAKRNGWHFFWVDVTLRSGSVNKTMLLDNGSLMSDGHFAFNYTHGGLKQWLGDKEDIFKRENGIVMITFTTAKFDKQSVRFQGPKSILGIVMFSYNDISKMPLFEKE